jgi:hypothetical protein
MFEKKKRLTMIYDTASFLFPPYQPQKKRIPNMTLLCIEFLIDLLKKSGT